MNITLTCGIFGLLAQLFSIFMNVYNAKIKSKAANLIFSWKDFFSVDAFRIGAIFIALVMYLIVLQYINFTPIESILVAGLIGYVGQDVLLRVFSKVNQSLNAAIDYKTTQYDTANGTVNKPTPATPVK